MILSKVTRKISILNWSHWFTKPPPSIIWVIEPLKINGSWNQNRHTWLLPEQTSWFGWLHSPLTRFESPLVLIKTKLLANLSSIMLDIEHLSPRTAKTAVSLILIQSPFAISDWIQQTPCQIRSCTQTENWQNASIVSKRKMFVEHDPIVTLSGLSLSRSACFITASSWFGAGFWRSNGSASSWLDGKVSFNLTWTFSQNSSRLPSRIRPWPINRTWSLSNYYSGRISNP